MYKNAFIELQQETPYKNNNKTIIKHVNPDKTIIPQTVTEMLLTRSLTLVYISYQY